MKVLELALKTLKPIGWFFSIFWSQFKKNKNSKLECFVYFTFLYEYNNNILLGLEYSTQFERDVLRVFDSLTLVCFSCLTLSPQVCVVFSQALKSWCRAVVESVMEGTLDAQAWCLLVDHGDHIIVRADEYETFYTGFL